MAAMWEGSCMTYAEICGDLEKVVIINGTNSKYGIIFIIVDHKKGMKDWLGIYKSNCIPVFVWEQDVLDKFTSLAKDDERIWLVGKLEPLDDSLLIEIHPFIELAELEKSDNLIISVMNKNRIQTISKELANTSWLSISSY